MLIRRLPRQRRIQPMVLLLLVVVVRVFVRWLFHTQALSCTNITQTYE